MGEVRSMIDWKMADEEYTENFRNKDNVNETYPADFAFGSVYIQRSICYTDREHVDQLAETPICSTSIGHKECCNERTFDQAFL